MWRLWTLRHPFDSSERFIFFGAGNAQKSMRRGMTNVLTLALGDLKGSTSLDPSKKKENGKENMFDFGQRTKQEKVFPLL